MQMFKKLGTPGASSLLGGIAVVFVPAPFLLYKYGKKIRAMSKNAYVLNVLFPGYGKLVLSAEAVSRRIVREDE